MTNDSPDLGKEPDLRPLTRRVGPKVTAPARETMLPGVFASNALETVYFIQCGEKSVLVDTDPQRPEPYPA